MKDELNCSHNGGGVVYLLQSVAIHINLTVCIFKLQSLSDQVYGRFLQYTIYLYLVGIFPFFCSQYCF